MDQFVLGARVRLVRRAGGNYPGASFCIEPGPIGTVIKSPEDFCVDEFAPNVGVRFDDRVADLDMWDNIVIVGDDFDATADHFETL
jgi:hypothetical protein